MPGSKKLLTKTCVICKRKFKTHSFVKVTCSKECQRENARRHCLLWYHNHKDLSPHSKRQCLNCGCEFVPKNSLQKYCSKDCSRQFYKTNRPSPLGCCFRTDIRVPKKWRANMDYDFFDPDLDESQLPWYQKRNSILMSFDPYPVEY